jgi:hypothetical protein
MLVRTRYPRELAELTGTVTSRAFGASYHDINNNFDDLKLAHCSDPNCSSTVTPILVDPFQAGVDVSLVLNPGGNPVITISMAVWGTEPELSVRGDLRGCELRSSNTIVQPDSTSMFTGLDTSTIIDVGGNPVVSYHDGGTTAR